MVAVFSIIYAMIALVNHYHFRTYALDLGAYTNALWDYARFRWNDSSVFRAVPENLLADHFDLYLPALAPLSFVFGTYTLPVVQIVAILAGGIGIYRLFSSNASGKGTALAAMAWFYLFFGVFSAVAFDYHSNVVAACLVPWLMRAVKRRRVFAATALLFLILASKENVSLWMAFVCLGLAFEYRSDHGRRYALLAGSALSLLWFAVVTSLVMPLLSVKGSYPHFHYTHFGTSLPEAIANAASRPGEAFLALFVNHTGFPPGYGVKAEFHILLLVSGLPFLFLKPQYLLMLLPLFFQKMFHDNYALWGIGGQYSVEFAPVMAAGIFLVAGKAGSARLRNILLVTAVAGGLAATVRTMDNTVYFTDKSAIRIYKAGHYKRDYDVRAVHQALDAIPANVAVSAQSPFVPHLALRDHVYQFPIIRDAEYVVFSEKELPYPLDQETFDSITGAMKDSPAWKKIWQKEGVTILKRADS